MSDSNVTICRVYHPPTHKKGIWVLVDRLWPRGIKKDEITLDLWLKEIAPSPSLRKWFNHDPAKWSEFRHRYIQELKNKQASIELILDKAKQLPVTLFYAAKDTKHNHALVLQETLQSWPNLPE